MRKWGEMLREPLGLEAEIDEAGAGDFQRGAHFGDVEGVDDLLGDLAGVGALLLGENHRDVGLVVAKAGVVRGLHLGLEGGRSWRWRRGVWIRGVRRWSLENHENYEIDERDGAGRVMVRRW